MPECNFCGVKPGERDSEDYSYSLNECSKCGNSYCNDCVYTVYYGGSRYMSHISYCSDCGPEVEREIRE